MWQTEWRDATYQTELRGKHKQIVAVLVPLGGLGINKKCGAGSARYSKMRTCQGNQSLCVHVSVLDVLEQKGAMQHTNLNRKCD